MKTTLKHLEDLHEEHAIKAIANLHAEDTDGEIASMEFVTLNTALFNAFDWDASPQGYAFWDSIYNSILDETYFDAPQLTPETCEARAKEIYTAPPTEPNFGTELAAAALPTDAAERKKFPIYSGFMCYFPHAIAAVANLSYKGNLQHHPDKPLHWDMDKSQDELDALMRHMIDGDWAQVAWRAMANLERKLTGKCQYTNK